VWGNRSHGASRSAAAVKNGRCFWIQPTKPTKQHLRRESLQFLLEVLEDVQQKLGSLLFVLQKPTCSDTFSPFLLQRTAQSSQHLVGVLKHVRQLLELCTLLGTLSYSALQCVNAFALDLQLLVHLTEETLQVSELAADVQQLFITMPHVLVSLL